MTKNTPMPDDAPLEQKNLSIEQLKGLVRKGAKPVTLEQMDEAIQQGTIKGAALVGGGHEGASDD